VVAGLGDADPDHPLNPWTPYGLMTQHGLSSVVCSLLTASLSAVAMVADENKSTNNVPTTSANLNLTTIITSPQGAIRGRKKNIPLDVNENKVPAGRVTSSLEAN
jgi:hypothetical protein